MADYQDRLENEEDLMDDEEDTQKDKYITFHLSEEEYAIEINYVTEIIGIQKITHLPDTPEFVMGVINLRGRVIPIIDMRMRFNLEKIDYGNRTCIIVVSVGDTSFGLIVDEVSEVLDIPEEQIEPTPQTTKGSNSRYIKGIGKVGDSVKIILGIDKILREEEMTLIANQI